MITPDQIRAARALKNWSQSELALRTGLAAPTIANIELGKQKPSAETLNKIKVAFETADIEFTEGEGVRKKKDRIFVLKGREGFEKFYNAVYEETRKNLGTELLLNNISESIFKKWIPNIFIEKHLPEMEKNFKTTWKILICEGDKEFLEHSTGYRWIPKKEFDSVSFYVFGKNLGIFLFCEEKGPTIILLQNEDAANAYREQFYSKWKHSLEIPETAKQD